MLKFFYQWRYKRSQRAGAFKLPSPRRDGSFSHVGLSSYLSQDSVRGREFSRFNLPQKRVRWLRIVAACIVLFFIGWVLYESILALIVFSN